jgi:DNA-binding NarL/FixJ family response regulator
MREGNGQTRILIADDHDVVRRGLRDILQDRPGWEVVAEAGNGQDAISATLKHKPDIAIVDYALPLLNGIEVTRQIRARIPQTQVLIFTMHDSEMLLQQALQAGARGFLLKSDADDLLIAAVHALTQHKPFFTGRVSEKLLQSFLVKTDPISVLTPREQSVVQLIAEGKTNKEMGQVLSLSTKTIESHRASAMRKLNMTTTAELIRYAIRNKLVES